MYELNSHISEVIHGILFSKSEKLPLNWKIKFYKFIILLMEIQRLASPIALKI